MQILGKRSKILLIAVAIVMLVAIGVSFAAWDISAVKAASGNSSTYANAKVGDVIEFGNYYQTLDKDASGEYIKTPIEWIVVDKDERTGQLTLMSKYILACGSYFGNYYYDKSNVAGYNYSANSEEVGKVNYNQAYVDSTARAFLNNLERMDMGGDGFVTGTGYVPSKENSTIATGLLSSVGFSNQKYWTGLDYGKNENKELVDIGNKGFSLRGDEVKEIYYQRPINNEKYRIRPVARGFFDEAFTNDEKNIIVPKVIAGYTGHRWPDVTHNIAIKSYVEGAYDKVWLPSTTELNIANGVDWSNNNNDAWTNPSDEISSTVFDYFKNYSEYVNPSISGNTAKNASVADAVRAERTALAMNGKIGNYSIPVYDYQTNNINTNFSEKNSNNFYWTRTPSSFWLPGVRLVRDTGAFGNHTTAFSYIGVRPCVILKY